MHPHADPTVILFGVRHPQSKAIEDDTYYGDSSELSERGELQVPYIAKQIKELRPDIVLCSPAVRTMKIIMEKDTFFCRNIWQEPLIKEWPRAKRMQGRLNTEPEVEEYLQSRYERFMPGAETEHGEESCDQTIEIMEALESRLLQLGIFGIKEREKKCESRRATRICLVFHGNRRRQLKAWLLSQNVLPECDPTDILAYHEKRKRDHIEEFLRDFRKSYNQTGINPGAFMTPLWYGHFFRGSKVGWNEDDGWDMYLPQHLRDSEI